LLPVAERVKAALDVGRALLERDADVPHHLIESTADQCDARLCVGLVVV
jgi:hypothetical protein